MQSRYSEAHGDLSFTPVDVNLPDCVCDLLVEESVAFENIDTLRLVRLHEDLRGGVWEPPRLKADNINSQFCPQIFVATNGYHSNSRFLLAYLIKHLSGEEELSMVRLTQQRPQMVKTTEQNYHQQKRTTKIQTNKAGLAAFPK